MLIAQSNNKKVMCMMELFSVIFWCHFLNLVLVLSQGCLSYILLRKEEEITG